MESKKEEDFKSDVDEYLGVIRDKKATADQLSSALSGFVSGLEGNVNSLATKNCATIEKVKKAYLADFKKAKSEALTYWVGEYTEGFSGFFGNAKQMLRVLIKYGRFSAEELNKADKKYRGGVFF